MRKKILSMSIAAVMTAITSTGVMAFDTNGCPTCDTDGLIRAPEVTTSYEKILRNRLKNDVPNITEAQITTKIGIIKNLKKMAGYQGNLLPLSANTPANMSNNPHPPVQSVANLTVSPNNNLGDALIFPMFRQGDDWGTEIVVRNTDQLHAIVAKVAVYAAEKSEEVLDFNVYLSAADVVRFTIKDGKLESKDGSVLRVFPTPSSNVNDVGRSDWASKDHPFTHPVSVDSGYVIVYGMAQASNENDNFDRFDMRYHHNHNDLFKNYRRELDACRPGWRNGHQNAMVNGTYTRNTRASQSVINYSVAAPNQGVNCNLSSNLVLAAPINATIAAATNAARLASQITDKASATLALAQVQNMLNSVNALNGAVTNSQEVDKARKILEVAVAAIQRSIQLVQPGDQATPEELANIASSINDLAQQVAVAAAQVSSAATASAPGNFFGDVDASLTGTVRLFNENKARDLILPAKAIENFTSANKMLSTEGEIIALQDRKIQGTDDTNNQNGIGWARYNELGIRADARAFLVRNLSYNFTGDDVDNQLVITQPYKRVLVQLGNDDGYWQGADVGRDQSLGNFWANNDDNYGGYSFLYNVYDEHENMDPTAYTESPHNSGLFILKDELQKMANLEEASTETFFNNRQELGQNADKNGFALFNFTNMDGNRIAFPAIVTQMVGTAVVDKTKKIAVPQVNWIYSQTQNNQPK